MSAPHPKAQDDAPPPPAWLRPNGTIREVEIKDETPVPVAINLARLEKELSIKRLDEIAKLMRALTYGEMIELSEGINTPADTLHKWSKEHE